MSGHPLYYVEDAIRAAIRAYGPLTRGEIESVCGVSLSGARYAIRRMRDRKELRVAEWRRHASGAQKRPAPAYGLGAHTDAVLVPEPRSAIVKRRLARRRECMRAPAAAFGAMAQQLGRAA